MHILNKMNAFAISGILAYLFINLDKKDFVDEVIKLLEFDFSKSVLLYITLKGGYQYLIPGNIDEDFYITISRTFKTQSILAKAICETIILLNPNGNSN